MAPPNVQMLNQCTEFQKKFRILIKFQDFDQVSGFWPNFRIFSFRDNSSYRLNTLGPLCLWQCFKPVTLLHMFLNGVYVACMCDLNPPCEHALWIAPQHKPSTWNTSHYGTQTLNGIQIKDEIRTQEHSTHCVPEMFFAKKHTFEGCAARWWWLE